MTTSSRSSVGRWAATAMAVAAGALATIGVGCAGSEPSLRAAAPTSTSAAPTPTLPHPGDLGERDLDLRAGPVAEPLTITIPSIGVAAAVLGVGATENDVMDAPSGPAEDPVWQSAYWYRGSAVPGSPSTSVIAAHVNDPLGRPGPFARLGDLGDGDQIIVRDTRTGRDMEFEVEGTETFTLAEANEPDALLAMYGEGPVAGTWPVPSADGRARLTLITCTGTYRDGTHDQRMVVHATRVA